MLNNITVAVLNDIREACLDRLIDHLSQQIAAARTAALQPSEKARILRSSLRLINQYKSEKNPKQFNASRGNEIVEAYKRHIEMMPPENDYIAAAFLVVLVRNIKPAETSALTKGLNDDMAVWAGIYLLMDNGYEVDTKGMQTGSDPNPIRSLHKRLRYDNPSYEEIAAFYKKYARRKK